MKLLVDADGCPVVDLAIAAARWRGVPCLLICDTAHVLDRPGAETITVSKGPDSADLALVNRAQAGDVVVTQDYGLAAMCLAKKVRAAGGRLKGPHRREKAQDTAFQQALERLLAAEI